MHWHLSWRADPRGKALADQHYNRQNPDADQFVPPGRCLVLTTRAADALWVTIWQEHTQHAWPGAWVNSLFRRDPSAPLASELIRDAVAATRWRFGTAPAGLGIVSFIDERRVRSSNPGFCYLMAGWTRLEERTKEQNLVVVQQLPEMMPPAEPPIGAMLRLPIGG